jgi:tetratricopeptide (TPR) repeat protein
VGAHDLYAMLADAAVQQREKVALQKYAPLLEETVTTLEHTHYLATAHRAWGVLYRLEGAYEEAEVRLDQAVALFKGLDTRWQLGRTHFELGELAAERAEAAEAKRQYARALALFEEMGAVPDAERTRAALLSLE